MEVDPQVANPTNHDGTAVEETDAHLSTSLFKHGNDTNSVKLSPDGMQNDDHMHMEGNSKWIKSVSGKQYLISQRHLLTDIVALCHGRDCYLNGHNWDSRH